MLKKTALTLFVSAIAMNACYGMEKESENESPRRGLGMIKMSKDFNHDDLMKRAIPFPSEADMLKLHKLCTLYPNEEAFTSTLIKLMQDGDRNYKKEISSFGGYLRHQRFPVGNLLVKLEEKIVTNAVVPHSAFEDYYRWMNISAPEDERLREKTGIYRDSFILGDDEKYCFSFHVPIKDSQIESYHFKIVGAWYNRNNIAHLSGDPENSKFGDAYRLQPVSLAEDGSIAKLFELDAQPLPIEGTAFFLQEAPVWQQDIDFVNSYAKKKILNESETSETAEDFEAFAGTLSERYLNMKKDIAENPLNKKLISYAESYTTEEELAQSISASTEKGYKDSAFIFKDYFQGR